MKRAILIGPLFRPGVKGDRALFKKLELKAPDLRIAVDGGADAWFGMGLKPHFAIGDWDSVSAKGRNRILHGIPHIGLSPGKDRSDLHYALHAVLEWKPREITCLGFTGGRPDHHLASVMDLAAFAGEAPGVRALSAHGREGSYHFVAAGMRPWRGEPELGTTVSVFSVTGRAEGVTACGLRYGLRNETLEPSSRGLSNEGAGRPASISVKRGTLLVVLPF